MVLDRREPFRRVRLDIFNKKFFWDTLTGSARYYLGLETGRPWGWSAFHLEWPWQALPRLPHRIAFGDEKSAIEREQKSDFKVTIYRPTS